MPLWLVLDPMCQDSNPVETQVRTWTYCLFIRITHLVSGLTEAWVLCVSGQKEFSEKQSEYQEVDLLILDAGRDAGG